MKSKYDNIKTAAELVAEVAINGFSTKEEDICRAQDIMGHSCMEDFAELLKVEGRVDTFYFIITKIWNWKDVCEIWNKLTNSEHNEVVELRAAVKTMENRCEAYSKEIESLRAELKEEKADLMKRKDARIDSKMELEVKEQEILKLKARLFDLMESKTA